MGRNLSMAEGPAQQRARVREGYCTRCGGPSIGTSAILVV